MAFGVLFYLTDRPALARRTRCPWAAIRPGLSCTTYVRRPAQGGDAGGGQEHKLKSTPKVRPRKEVDPKKCVRARLTQAAKLTALSFSFFSY
jgi:hypothetical protein